LTFLRHYKKTQSPSQNLIKVITSITRKLGDYFRLPTIILSSFASVISVGLKSYISNQNHINLMVCVLSLIVGIINSIELYLKIQDLIEMELEKSKQFYELASDIFKVIRLDPENRPHNANETLDEFYNRYITLFNDSNLIKNIKDEILTIEKNKNVPSSANNTISSNASASSSDSPRVLNQIFTENI
jgi:hypothetical protein